MQTHSPSLYDTDFVQWTEQQAQYLRDGRYEYLDLENLIEEIEELGKSDQRSFASHIETYLEHRLKLDYWRSELAKNENNWRDTVAQIRFKHTPKLLEDNHRFKNWLKDDEWIQDRYEVALAIVDGLGVPGPLPPICPGKYREEVEAIAPRSSGLR